MPSKSSEVPSSKVTVPAVNGADPWLGNDAAFADEWQIVLALGDTGHERIVVSRASTPELRLTTGANDELLQARLYNLDWKSLTGENPEAGEDNRVQWHSGDDSLQYITLPAIAGHNSCRARHGQFAGNLDRADTASQHQNALATVSIGTAIRECVTDSERARKAVDAGNAGNLGLVIASRSHHDMRKRPRRSGAVSIDCGDHPRVAVALDRSDSMSQLDARRDPEAGGELLKIVADFALWGNMGVPWGQG